MKNAILATALFAVLIATPAAAQVIDGNNDGSITRFTSVTPGGTVQSYQEGSGNAGHLFLPISYSDTDYFTHFDLSGSGSATADSASIDLFLSSDNVYPGVSYGGLSVELDLLFNALTHSPESDPTQFENLNNGDVIGSINVPLENLVSGQAYAIDLNALGVQDLNSSGPDFIVSGVIGPVDGGTFNPFNVNIADSQLNLDDSGPTIDPPVAAPEPATWSLLLAGLIGAAGFRRFRASARA